MGGFLARLARVSLTVATSPVRWTCALLGKLRAPGWQRWGIIFAGLNVAATIVVALVLIGFTCELERRRHEESRADFSAWAEIFRPDDAEGHWFVELGVRSRGPATTHGVKIVLEAGDWGIKPLRTVATSRGVVSDPEEFGIFEPNGRSCYSWEYTVLIKDDIFPGDSLTISQEFAAEEWRDLELRQDPSLQRAGVSGWAGVSAHGAFRWGLANTQWPDQRPPLLTRAFLRSVDVVGDNVDFRDGWEGDFCP